MTQRDWKRAYLTALATFDPAAWAKDHQGRASDQAHAYAENVASKYVEALRGGRGA